MALSLALRYNALAAELGLIELRTAAVDSRITFTRASSRTYFDSAGVLQTATTDVWPLEFDPATGECLGRSVWAAATDLLLRSEEFDNAYWTKTRCSATADTTAAPDGATTMDTLTCTTTAAGGFSVSRTITITGSTVTASIFAKAGTTGWLAILVGDGGSNAYRQWFDIASAALGSGSAAGTGWSKVSADIVDVGDGIYRCTLAVNVTGTTCLFVVHPSPSGDSSFSCTSGDVGYLWGAQLETGSIATPYIPTTSATVTRALDDASVTDLTGLGFSSTAGTIIGEFIPAGVTADMTLLEFNDATANERIAIRLTSAGVIKALIVDGGSTQADIGTRTATARTAFRFALSWAANDIALSVNGQAVEVDTSATLPTLTTMDIGHRYDNTEHMRAWCRRLLYVPRALSDAEIVKASTL